MCWAPNVSPYFDGIKVEIIYLLNNLQWHIVLKYLNFIKHTLNLSYLSIITYFLVLFGYNIVISLAGNYISLVPLA